MKFILTIELGNEAMQTQGDLVDALRNLAVVFGASDTVRTRQREPQIGDSGPIYDANGNRVGGWHVE